jgi:LysM repeat protein
MEIQSEMFRKKKEAIEAVVQTKTVGAKQGKSAEELLPEAPAYEVGAGYVIHKVAETDTLDGVCLRYDVSKDMIRRANEFSGDEIYMKKELIIPRSS